jgi:hypothetical protein
MILLFDSTEEGAVTDVDERVLQQRYGGRYVARRGGEVVADAETYDELSERLKDAAMEWDGLVIEYVEPATVVRVY